MISSWLLSLPLLVNGAAVKHELFKRQGLDIFGLSSAENTVRKPVSTTKLRATVQNDAVREHILWGPFTLQPSNGTQATLKLESNSNIISTPISGLCSSCMVLNARVDVASADGKNIEASDGIYRKQIIIADIGRPLVMPPAVPACPNVVTPDSLSEVPLGAHARVQEPPPEVGASQPTSAKPSPTTPVPAVITIDSPAAAQTIVPGLGLDEKTLSGFMDQLKTLGSVWLGLAGLGSLGSFGQSLSSVLSAAIPGWSSAPKELQNQLLGGLVGGVLGAGLFSLIGAILGAGTGAVYAGPGGLNTLANLIPPSPPKPSSGAGSTATISGLLGSGTIGSNNASTALGALAGLLGASGAAATKPASSGTTADLASALSALSSLLGASRSVFPSVSVLVGQGGDTPGVNFFRRNQELKSGFWLDSTDSFNAMADLVNHRNEPQEVYIKLEYEYLPMKNRPDDYYDVGQSAITVTPCESSHDLLPKNESMKYQSPPWQIYADGYILDIKPQLRNGGINSTLYLNGESKCSSEAVYGKLKGGEVNEDKWETIVAYTECPKEIQIKAGDTLTMDAYYDLAKHKLRPQADNLDGEARGMALVNFLFARPYQA